MGINLRIFAMALGNDGMIYSTSMDSNQIIAFDGANWFKIPIPTPAASIQASTSGKIWVTQQDGIGYLERDDLGQFTFQMFATHHGNVELHSFWDCCRTEKGVRFASNQMICDIDETTTPHKVDLTIAGPDETFLSWDRSIIAKNTANSALSFADGETRKSFAGHTGADEVDYVVHLDNQQNIYVRDSWKKLVQWEAGGWKTFSAEFDELNNDTEFNWLMPMSGERIGCSGRAGFFCLDKSGKVLYQIKTAKLHNLGNIFSWKEFSDHRIGLACENGFAILTPQAARYEWPLFRYQNIGIYRLRCEDGILNVCSDAGFYEIDLGKLGATNNSFPVPVHDFPFHGCHIDETGSYFASANGIMRRSDHEMEVVVPHPHSEVLNLDDTHLLTCDVQSVATVYEKTEEGPYKALHSFPTCQDSSILVKQEDVIWFSTYRGDLAAYEFSDGPEHPQTTVPIQSDVSFKYAWAHGTVGDDFLVITDAGILVSQLEQTEFASRKDVQKPNANQTKIHLKQTEKYAALTETMVENQVGNIVACGESRVALIGFGRVSIHELVDGVYRAEPCNEWGTHPGDVVACWDEKSERLWQIEKGKLVAVDIEKFRSMPLAVPCITAATDNNLAGEPSVLAHRGDVKMCFGVPLVTQVLENVEYSHRLKGLKDNWSEWSSTSQVEYQGLPGGEYEFEVRARTNAAESAIASLPFQVQYHWSLGWGALATWITLFGLVIYGTTAWRSRSLIAANRKMEQLVAERSEEIEQKKLEIQRNATLLDQSERRNQSDRLTSLDTLVSGIAHDFNNLLMVISANNEMIKLTGDENIHRFVDNNALAVQSAADLCRELTDYTGSVPMELVVTSLNRVVDESRELIRDALPDSVEVSYSLVDDGDECSIMADARILKRALVNLVINAGECCDQQIEIQTSNLTLTEDQLNDARYVGNPPSPGRYTCLTVTDDGPGIRPEQMERLFDPFFSTKQLGRGLGLAIVMRVLGRHNGAIFVTSQPGSGAKFELCFPATSWPPQNAAPRTSTRPKTEPKNLNLLLVDDEMLVLRSTEQILKSSGYRCEAFADAKEALLHIFDEPTQDCPFDCVILDVSMPGMTGPEMAELIRDQFPQTPIIFVSGYSHSSFEIGLLQEPNVSFLTKPYNFEQIDLAIQQVVQPEVNRAARG